MKMLLIVTLVHTCVNGVCDVQNSIVSEEFCMDQIEWFREVDPNEEQYKAECAYLVSFDDAAEEEHKFWEHLPWLGN